MTGAVKFLAGVLAGLGLFAAGYLVGLRAGRTAPVRLPDPVVIRDTTVFEVRPRLIASGTLTQTVRVEVRDTVRDIVVVGELPRESRTYADSSYRAVVSGIDPRLDSLWIRQVNKTVYIPYQVAVEADPPRWSFGLSAGPGILYDGRIRAGFGLVAGVQYRF